VSIPQAIVPSGDAAGRVSKLAKIESCLFPIQIIWRLKHHEGAVERPALRMGERLTCLFYIWDLSLEHLDWIPNDPDLVRISV
jgi:hypothetical protein